MAFAAAAVSTVWMLLLYITHTFLFVNFFVVIETGDSHGMALWKSDSPLPCFVAVSATACYINLSSDFQELFL